MNEHRGQPLDIGTLINMRKYPMGRTPSRAYLRGCYYAAPFNPATREAKRRSLLAIATPPETRAVWDPEARSWRNDPILGCLRIPAGIPFVAEIEGDERRLFTVAACQTLESLRQYPDRFPAIQSASQEMYHIIFGLRDPVTNAVINSPFFCLPGLRRNDRSGTPDLLSYEYRYNGSYNVSSTLMQGQGQGTVLPAEQVDSPESVHILGRMGRLIHALYHLIVPTCVSKLEWETSQFRMSDLNVKATGGLEPAATAVQINISSAVNDTKLEDVIGRVQGKWHTDSHDAPALWTLGSVYFRLPPNSDVGRFFLGRPGLYVEEKDLWVIYIVFHGTDVHSGFAPSVDPTLFPHWWKHVQANISMLGPESRCFVVAYLGLASTSRTTDFSISPPLTFGNAGSPMLYKDRRNNYVQHGYPAMGDFRSYYNNLAREAAYQLWNMSQVSGIRIPSVNAILSLMSYDDEEGRPQQMEDAPFDPVADAERVRILRGGWKLHHLHAMQYYIRISKAELFSRLEAIRKENPRAEMVGDAAPTIASAPTILEHERTDPRLAPVNVNGQTGLVQKEVNNDTRAAHPGVDSDNEAPEALASTRNAEGKEEYLLKFKGYPTSEWTSLDKIDAAELMEAFHAKQPQTAKRKRTKEWPRVEQSGRTHDSLECVLSAAHLRQEAVDLARAIAVLANRRDLSGKVQALAEKIQVEEAQSRQLFETSPSERLSDSHSMSILANLTASMDILTEMEQQQHFLLIWTHIVNWERARASLKAYSWLMDVAPELTDKIFASYRQGSGAVLRYADEAGRTPRRKAASKKVEAPSPQPEERPENDAVHVTKKFSNAHMAASCIC
ncbi:hypothetical protein EV714DRAFT_239466 [Schizophyllum commune]